MPRLRLLLETKHYRKASAEKMIAVTPNRTEKDVSFWKANESCSNFINLTILTSDTECGGLFTYISQFGSHQETKNAPDFLGSVGPKTKSWGVLIKIGLPQSLQVTIHPVSDKVKTFLEP